MESRRLAQQREEKKIFFFFLQELDIQEGKGGFFLKWNNVDEVSDGRYPRAWCSLPV